MTPVPNFEQFHLKLLPSTRELPPPQHSSTCTMRLTTELLTSSLSYLNPLKERELDLRGKPPFPLPHSQYRKEQIPHTS